MVAGKVKIDPVKVPDISDLSKISENMPNPSPNGNDGGKYLEVVGSAVLSGVAMNTHEPFECLKNMAFPDVSNFQNKDRKSGFHSATNNASKKENKYE